MPSGFDSVGISGEPSRWKLVRMSPVQSAQCVPHGCRAENLKTIPGINLIK